MSLLLIFGYANVSELSVIANIQEPIYILANVGQFRIQPNIPHKMSLINAEIRVWFHANLINTYS